MMRVIVYLLSAVALILGGLALISAILSPSTDPLIFARDLTISLTAVLIGAAAPLLHKKFAQQSQET